MIFFLDKISQIKIGWNSKPLTEKDFYKLCRKFRIKVTEMPLRVEGFYYCVKGKHFIAINSNLSGLNKLVVMFHEFAHFLHHIPNQNVTANFSGAGNQDFKEVEADIFAICALIPLTWVKAKTVRDLIEDEGFSEELVHKRKQIYESYKI